MKVAIIGSGPAAIGVLTALRDHSPAAEVTVFDIGGDPSGAVTPPPSGAPADPAYYRRLYRHLRRHHGYSFPPPKSHFGLTAPRVSVSGRPRIWNSGLRGGLSTLWGAAVSPFTDRELADWPISASDLEPHYRRIAEVMGISGDVDGLNTYFTQDHVNRPPINLPGNLTHLKQSVNNQLIAGTARLAVETRPDVNKACIRCGDCMTGCPTGAIYSTLGGLRDETLLAVRVSAIDTAARRLVLANGDTTAPFERIFVCAGALGSTEILMRTFGINEGPVMTDNAVFTFPIIYTGPDQTRPGEPAPLALTNLLVGHIQGNDQPMVPVQIYPSFAHLWRYYLPASLWSLPATLARRIFWARVYLPAAQSHLYAVTLRDNELELSLRREASKGPAKRVRAHLRQALKGSGFVLPPVPLIAHATSSHYGATLPFGNDLISVDTLGQVAPGIQVCDSAVFPDMPALSPTFTIMANAHRMTIEGLNA